MLFNLFSGPKERKIIIDRFRPLILRQETNNYCTQPGLKKFRENNITMEHKWIKDPLTNAYVILIRDVIDKWKSGYLEELQKLSMGGRPNGVDEFLNEYKFHQQLNQLIVM